MSDLSPKEQRNVRTALRFLHVRLGLWRPIAAAMRVSVESLPKVAAGGAVTASLAFRLARLVEVPLEELLDGSWLSPRVCPHCGHPPEDFTDEETVVEDRPREAVLKLVK